jgi:hypothetical protein
MVPWVERPTIEIDLATPARRRYAGIPSEAFALGRYDALCRFFAGHRADQEVDDSALLYILSAPGVIQEITAQHIIMRPGQGTIRLLVPRPFMSQAGLAS